MTNDTNDPTTLGRGALRDALTTPTVPPELMSRVRTSLDTRGLVRQPPRRGPIWLTRVGLLAAGVLLGALLRMPRSSTESPPPAATTPQYVLLLYGDTPGDTGAVHLAREREYGRWASELGDGARWVGGHELHEVVAQLGSRTPSSTLGSERIAGYFVIEAESRERAAEVAQSCPHVKYGGRVVVMSIAS